MTDRTFDTLQKRRLKSSYASVVISISVVLFMIGALGLIVLKSTKVANHFKEEVVMSLFLRDAVNKEQTEIFMNSILMEDFTKKVAYISKEKAAQTYSQDLGEDFIKFLGMNPLKNCVDIYFKANYVTPKEMKSLEEHYANNLFVADIFYDKPLVEQLTENIKRIGFWLLMLSAFFALVSVILINSSIRLSIYSKRFNIKTMQMVGATKDFIRKPFVWQSVRLGFIGAFLSFLFLSVLIYYLNKMIPSLDLIKDYLVLVYLAMGILMSSLLITWISTYFATQRFLNLQTNELYY